MGRPAVMLVVYGALFVALCFPVTARAACPFKQMGLAPAPHLIKSAGAPRVREGYDPGGRVVMSKLTASKARGGDTDPC